MKYEENPNEKQVINIYLHSLLNTFLYFIIVPHLYTFATAKQRSLPLIVEKPSVHRRATDGLS